MYYITPDKRAYFNNLFEIVKPVAMVTVKYYLKKHKYKTELIRL